MVEPEPEPTIVYIPPFKPKQRVTFIASEPSGDQEEKEKSRYWLAG